MTRSYSFSHIKHWLRFSTDDLLTYLFLWFLFSGILSGVMVAAQTVTGLCFGMFSVLELFCPL